MLIVLAESKGSTWEGEKTSVAKSITNVFGWHRIDTVRLNSNKLLSIIGVKIYCKGCAKWAHINNHTPISMEFNL